MAANCIAHTRSSLSQSQCIMSTFFLCGSKSPLDSQSHAVYRSLHFGFFAECWELLQTDCFEMNIFIYFTAVRGVNLICIDTFHTISLYA